MKQLDYTIVDHYELITRDSYYNGMSSNNDDREGVIIMVETKNGTVYVDYEEAYYHFSCTKNEDGINVIYLNDEEYIEIPSETTDFHYSIYGTYEEAIDAVKRIEDFGYYIVRFWVYLI